MVCLRIDLVAAIMSQGLTRTLPPRGPSSVSSSSDSSVLKFSFLAANPTNESTES